jgi:YD repeat-containing protein
MKKNLFKTAIMLSTVVFFAACQKEKTATGNNEISEQASAKGRPQELTRIKTRTIDQDVRTYTYDAAGRSLGYTSNYGNLTYEYPDATHVIETPSASDVMSHELNSKGLVIKSVVGANIFQDFYTYNGKKQLTQLFVQDNGGNASIITYTYVNGNLDNQQTTYDGSPSSDVSYTYFTDKANVLDNDVFGESFRGVGSKNLVKSSTTHFEGISTTYVMDYSYVFDPQGRVIKVMRSQNGLALSDINYTYY